MILFGSGWGIYPAGIHQGFGLGDLWNCSFWLPLIVNPTLEIAKHMPCTKGQGHMFFSNVYNRNQNRFKSQTKTRSMRVVYTYTTQLKGRVGTRPPALGDSSQFQDDG